MGGEMRLYLIHNTIGGAARGFDARLGSAR
jgi:hypothetical protein